MFSPETTKPERKKLTPRQTKGLLMATLALSAAFLPGCASNAKVPEQRQTAPIEQPAQKPAAAETETQAEKVPSVAELQISADLSQEEIAKTIVDRLESLYTTGLKQEVYDQFDAGYMKGGINSNSIEWSKRYSQPFLANYYEALFGKDYKSNKDVKDFIALSDYTVVDNFDRYLSTSSKELKAQKGHQSFEYKMRFEKVIPFPNKSMSIYVNETDNNNETNLAGTSYDRASANAHNKISVFYTEVENSEGKKVIQITSMVSEPAK